MIVIRRLSRNRNWRPRYFKRGVSRQLRFGWWFHTYWIEEDEPWRS